MVTVPRLSVEQQRDALRRVALWRNAPDMSVGCPACETRGLVICDRSARPHAEWYQLTCRACGLDETIGVPLGSMPPVLE